MRHYILLKNNINFLILFKQHLNLSYRIATKYFNLYYMYSVFIKNLKQMQLTLLIGRFPPAKKTIYVVKVYISRLD
jgi:hypothetical protein